MNIVTKDMGTGDSLPISQKPYNLSLKLTAWVQKELETLEKAAIIVQSVLPWASPSVVVPKSTQPAEHPSRRLCIDYRALNNLLPMVTKAHSKAKGFMTFGTFTEN